MFINLIYNTGLPGGSPSYADPYEYQNRLPDYKRADLGIMYLVKNSNKLFNVDEISVGFEIFNMFKFNNEIRRLPIFGYGCAGGVLGMNRATEIFRSIRKPILVCNVELCSLTFRPQIFSKENIISTALFGDGCVTYIVGDEGDCKLLKSPPFIPSYTSLLF